MRRSALVIPTLAGALIAAGSFFVRSNVQAQVIDVDACQKACYEQKEVCDEACSEDVDPVECDQRCQDQLDACLAECH
jgi:hypothetical protein